MFAHRCHCPLAETILKACRLVCSLGEARPFCASSVYVEFMAFPVSFVASKYLGYMQYLDIFFPSGNTAEDVHQAADIAAGNGVCFGGQDIVNFLIGHGGTDLGIVDTEGPPKTATGITVLHLDQFKTPDIFKQGPRLFGDSQSPAQMAGIMIGDCAGKFCADIAYLRVRRPDTG